MKKSVVYLFFYFLILLTWLSCDVSGENTDVAQEIKIAETVINDFRQVKIKNGRPLYEIKAQKAETFIKENNMRVYGVEFSQFDKNQEVVSDGIATKVDFNTSSENATIEGYMRFHSKKEKVYIESQWLDWNNERKRLTGKSDIPVKIEKEDGTVLEGSGFSATTDNKTITFSNGMKGVFIPQKEKENEAP